MVELYKQESPGKRVEFYCQDKLSRCSPGRQRSMCLATKGWLQGRVAKLLLACWKSRYNEDLRICLAANGQAIWGGCVTRRSIRAVPIQFVSKPEICHGAEI